MVLRTTDLMIDSLVRGADKQSPACPKKSNCSKKTLCPKKSHIMSTCDNATNGNYTPDCSACGDNTASELRALRDELRRTLEAELVGA